MVSWTVTGATRGIGFGFVNILSADSNNEVFALIRSRATAGPLEKLAASRPNIKIVETDISNPKKLEQAAAEVSKATGGSLDVLILNAGSAGPDTAPLTPTAFHGKEEALEKELGENIKANLTSNIYVIHAFLDLIRNGNEKKIAFVTSNSGNIEFTRITGLAALLGYSVAKAGMELVMTKFGIDLAPEGIKTVSISPGWVDTDAAKAITGDPELRKFFLSAFHKLDASVKGPISVEESVTAQLDVIRRLTDAESGKVLTHHGDNTSGVSPKWF